MMSLTFFLAIIILIVSNGKTKTGNNLATGSAGLVIIILPLFERNPKTGVR